MSKNVFQSCPWYKQYPKQVPQEIDPKHYHSTLELFDEVIENYSNRPAFKSFGYEITYQQLDELSRNFASFLTAELGLKKGDRFAIQVPNLLQFPIAMFGAMRAGIVVVNVNPLYTAREMEHQLNDSGAKGILIYENFAFNLEKIIDKTSIESIIVTGTGDALPFVKKTLVNFAVRKVKKMVPKYRLPKAIGFNQALTKGSKHTFEKVQVTLEDVAFLQYTGGTTGVAKGAILTHGNMVGALEQCCAWIAPILEANKIPTVITALPLYHIFALMANCLFIFKLGGKNILIPNARDFPAFIRIMKDNPFSMITGVNTLYNALLNNEDFNDIDFSQLKVSLGGGMAVQDTVAQKWKEATGCVLSEAYGLTETSPAVCINPLDGSAVMGSIGLPIPSTEIQIVTDSEKLAGFDEPGELWVRGPQVMKGYWNRPDETADALTQDGWFKTGDIATMDSKGYVRIVDRKKEMILVSGFNVYPNEVENVVSMHKKVLEVGAIGIPHPKSNEVVKIFVVKRDPSLTEEELLSFCKENMTGYKVPKAVEFMKELPKTNVGKILRRKLKEMETEKNEKRTNR
ncbi:MAG: AMP-binding protein [Cytophagales bacterium]|nr:AMP-binding protein [Cytophagales bacterium]